MSGAGRQRSRTSAARESITLPDGVRLVPAVRSQLAVATVTECSAPVIALTHSHSPYSHSPNLTPSPSLLPLHSSPPSLLPPPSLCVTQIRDPEKEKAACASPRARVASFPTTVVEGMLFAWLESGPEAEQEAAAQQPYIMPEQVRSQACAQSVVRCSSCAVSSHAASVLCWLMIRADQVTRDVHLGL